MDYRLEFDHILTQYLYIRNDDKSLLVEFLEIGYVLFKHVQSGLLNFSNKIAILSTNRRTQNFISGQNLTTYR